MSKNLTLAIVYDENKILLGMKKRGFGSGRWNGFGGKIEQGESIDQAAIRELEEEAGIKALNLTPRGKLLFTFNDSSPDMYVNIFGVSEFSGNPVETEEMLPKWFAHDEIPYAEMWADDEYWLPLFLEGKNITGQVDFDNPTDQNIVSNSIREYVD
jgi:8-oxo-dGTP pyrophosphatase MutT (NUDIX family)